MIKIASVTGGIGKERCVWFSRTSEFANTTFYVSIPPVLQPFLSYKFDSNRAGYKCSAVWAKTLLIQQFPLDLQQILIWYTNLSSNANLSVAYFIQCEHWKDIQGDS